MVGGVGSNPIAPTSIAETLIKVLDGGPEVEARRQTGLEIAASTNWDNEFKKFSSYLEAYE